MKCSEFKTQALLLMDHRLNDAVRQELEKHREECRTCSEYVEKLARVWQAELPELDASPAFRQRVMARLQSESSRPSRMAELWEDRLLPALRPTALVMFMLVSIFLGRWLATPTAALNNNGTEPQDMLSIEYFETLTQESLAAVYLSLGEETDE
ncbi:MAG: hypothetical protein Q9P90_01165 [candidate division KSB1 bacterium]|nr:hypothetical protein [candidate division KSB1 bacterium]